MGRKVISGSGGKTGRVIINTVELCVTEWTGTEIAEEEEVTSSCSQGNNEFEYGNAYVEGTISADFDATIDFTAVPGIRAGVALTNVYLWLNSSHADAVGDGVGIYMPTMYPNNISITTPVKGKVTYTFNYRSSATYTFLHGTVTEV